MRYFYIGLAILLLCLALCFTVTAVLDHYTEEAASLLEQAAERADRGDFQAAAQLVARTRDFWEQHHGFFGIALRHAESDTINSTFRELLEYAENECTEEFEPTCADLIAQIRHLSDMEKPYYYNILAAGPPAVP